MNVARRIATGVVRAALVVLCLARPAGALEPVLHPLAGVTLEDPDGRAWRLDELVRQAVLVVVADRSASGGAVEWGRTLGAARPQSIALWAAPGKVAVVSVADLRGVPSFARGTARWMIAAMMEERQGEAGPPLLLDWEGTVAARVAAEPDTPNVRLYAADGALVLRDEGDATPDKVARLAAAVDALVAQSAGAAPSPAASATPGGEAP